MKIFRKLLICMVILFSSCGGGERHIAMLYEIDGLCDSDPRAAMARLDSIDRDALSEKERHYHDLLSIKSRDKAYVRHTSDSLVLDVIDYYSSHNKDPHYPEALYYGGRVYSDIGDLPTALEFFQKSLDVIPEDSNNLRFKSTVMNQTGRLLHSLRLDSAAVEYLEKSLDMRPKKDSNDAGTSFTHCLIASSLMHLNNFKDARRHINEAVRISSRLHESDRQTIQSSLAEMFYMEGKIDSAISIIRPLPSSVDSITMPYCLAISAKIYLDAGILDTAYIYARRLTRLSAPNNKETGYKVIFSDRMADFVSKDTLQKLIPEYKQTVEDYLNTHEGEQAIIQNTRYNYSLHIREREKAEHKLRSLKENMLIGAGGTVIIFLIFLSVSLSRKYHKSRKDSQIMEGIMLADRLKEEYVPLSNEDMEVSKFDSKSMECPDARKRILDEIQSYKDNNSYESIDEKIKQSSLYKDLKEKAENKRVMGKDVTWREIEELIESASAGFDRRLDIITKNQITSSERKVAHLIKCGFTQVQIASLLAKDPSTISAHRSSLAKKIGYDKSTVAVIIIRL